MKNLKNILCILFFTFTSLIYTQCFKISTVSPTNITNIATNTTITNSENSTTGNNHEKHLVEIKCTSNCICDHYQGLRRATCVNKRMIFLKDNVPRRTEILVFTQNYVTNIRNDEFHDNELEGLKVLNLSYNHIGQIEIFAFEHMKQLRILDLSHNAMQYILAEWFWSLESLEELYLDNNNLGAFQDVPLFESHSLQVLSLANCQISHLFPQSFSKMPEIQALDVSGNRLIDFKYSVIAHLQMLLRINIEKNPIKCQDLTDLITFLDENAIEHKDECHMSVADADYVEEFNRNDTELKKYPKFEKMMDGTGTNEDGEDAIETSWIFEETITDQGVKVHDCTALPTGFLWEIIEMSPIISLIATLLFGFLIGLIIGCSCTCGKQIKVKRRKNIKSIRRVSRSFSCIRNGPVLDRQYLINQEF